MITILVQILEVKMATEDTETPAVIIETVEVVNGQDGLEEGDLHNSTGRGAGTI